MPKCLLCFTIIRKSRSKTLNQLLVQDTTLCDAINQQIQFNILPLDKPTTSQVSCRNCFNAFKSFYQFLHKVKSNLRPLKAENCMEVPLAGPKDVFIKVERCTSPDAVVESNSQFDAVLGISEGALGSRIKSGSFEDKMTKTESISGSRGARPNDITSSAQFPDPGDTKTETGPASHQSKLHPEQQNNSNGLEFSLEPENDNNSDFEWSSDDQMDSIEETPQKRPKPNLDASKKPKTAHKKLGSEPTARKLKIQADEARIKSLVDLKCQYCSAPTESFNAHIKHIRTIHPGQRAVLLGFDRTFSKRFRLLDYLNSFDKSKVLKCDICNNNKIYKSELNLNSHINHYHRSKAEQAICDECGKFFPNQTLLRAHIKWTHLVDETKKFECYICRDMRSLHFKNIWYLKAHLRTNHRRKPKRNSSCAMCGKSVVNLDAHMKTMHAQKQRDRVKCGVCETWLLESSLHAHMQTHSSDVGKTCDICGKFLRSSLSVHKRRMHSQHYEFTCEYCDKGFLEQTKMLEHVASMHTREFLLMCRVPGCETQFRSESQRKEHEKKQHPVEYDKFFKPMFKRGPDELKEFEELVKYGNFFE